MATRAREGEVLEAVTRMAARSLRVSIARAGLRFPPMVSVPATTTFRWTGSIITRTRRATRGSRTRWPTRLRTPSRNSRSGALRFNPLHKRLNVIQPCYPCTPFVEMLWNFVTHYKRRWENLMQGKICFVLVLLHGESLQISKQSQNSFIYSTRSIRLISRII